jgi:hypothetical protein
MAKQNKPNPSPSKTDRDHEMESLKSRISTLEEQLETKSNEYDDATKALKTVDTECNKLTEENTRLKEQLADALAAPTPVVGYTESSNVPMEIRASLIITAIAAIKDRQNDAPLDRKNFEHMVDPFIEQAAYIADKVIALCNQDWSDIEVQDQILKSL